MLTNLMVLVAAVSPLPNPVSTGGPASYDRPRVEVWTNRGDDPYRTGQHARVFLRADRDAYVTLFRVDTDGRVRVLFPRDPWDDNFVRGGRDFEVSGMRGDDAFDIDDYPGVGYLFAVAAADPYRYDPITSGDHWDYRVIADGRVRGDPYVALTDLAQQMLPQSYEDWDYDIVPYYVQQHYDYPRFLCYDCHRYASYAFWDPYAYSCVRFRIVVYDDPYYYPYRYYGGTRVVFTRPFRPEPRFIFKDRDGARNERFVSHERQRPVNDTRRRGVRGADLGRRGSVPVPEAGPRRRNDRPADPQRRGNRPDDPRARRDGHQQPPAQPDRPNRPNPNRPDHGDPARPGQGRRPDVPPPARRPDPPARPDNTWRRPAERPSQPPARPQVDRRWDRTSPRAQPNARRDPPRRAQPANQGRRQPARAQPNTRAGRSRQPARSSSRGKGKPQLKRRRPSK